MDARKAIRRTEPQNNSLHLWFRLLAEQLNDAGYEQKLTIGTIDTPWNEGTVKSLYAKIAKFQFNKIHTSSLTTRELTAVSETLNRAFAANGVYVPFPTRDEFEEWKV